MVLAVYPAITISNIKPQNLTYSENKILRRARRPAGERVNICVLLKYMSLYIAEITASG